MTLYDIDKFAHAALGAVALLSFWTTAAARKGGPLHKASGKVYMSAMLPVVLLGIPLVLRQFLEGNLVFGVFFSHIFLITAMLAWQGWRAVRAKRDWRAYSGGITRVLSRSTGVSGAAAVVVGAIKAAPIFFVFGAVGILLWWQAEGFARRGPQASNWWLLQHTRGVVGGGIATHVAFLSLGLRRMFPALDGAVLGYFAWFGPLTVGIATLVWLRRRYAPKKAVATQTSPSVDQPSPVPR